MAPLFLISSQTFVFINRRKLRKLNKFYIILGCALNYGNFILVFPILALLYQVYNYSWYPFLQTISQPIVISACHVTFTTALFATVINIFFGVILAWILVKYKFPGKRLLDIGVDLPFALPTSVGGLTLMTVYSETGWLGPICSWFGIKIAFSRLGVLIAMIFVSLPFVTRTIQPVLYNIDTETEEAAWCIGASYWTTFWRILFPPLTSSLITGAALAFSRAIGEYGSIVLVSSNIQNKDLVVSVLIFQRLEQYDFLGATSIAMLALCLSFGMLLTINCIQLWRRNSVR